MNDTHTREERERGERIARGLMKALALIGLIAVLALITWAIARVSGILEPVRENLSGGVISLDRLFSDEEEESLRITLERKVLDVSRESFVPFTHTGVDTAAARYTFSYECRPGVSFDVRDDYTWKRVTCGTPYTLALREPKLALIPTSSENRYTDLTLTIATADSEEVRDSVMVTLVNPKLASSTDILGRDRPESGDTPAPADMADTSGNDAEPSRPTTPPVVATPASPAPAPTQYRAPAPVGPADLAVNIVGTGLLLDVAGKRTFVAYSEIPSDGNAAIRFTVKNVGGQPSGPWGFVANLPIEGDPDYRYTSPLQPSLAVGQGVEFTLGFDEIRESTTGAVTITVVPGTTADRTANNRETVLVKILPR